MTRGKGRDRRAEVAASLAAHGVDRGFAIRVAETFVEKGPCAAIAQLYAGGWETYEEWVGDSPRVFVRSVRRVLTAKEG